MRLGSSNFERDIQMHAMTHTPFSCRPNGWIGQLGSWQIGTSRQRAAEVMDHVLRKLHRPLAAQQALTVLQSSSPTCSTCGRSVRLAAHPAQPGQ